MHSKTQKSLSDNDKKVGRPRNFNITVREFEFAAGAGFIVPILGDIMRMPGLPRQFRLPKAWILIWMEILPDFREYLIYDI
ncbi:MAG: formate--tetrahydrofolate ligase [Saprospiraceae bacterium]